MSTCPAPFPGLAPDAPARTASMVGVIGIPLLYLALLAFFRWNQQSSVFLRKRSFPMMVCSAAGAMLTWAMTVLYDVTGSQAFPCWLYFLIFYLAAPAFTLPGMMVILRYANEVSALRLAQTVGSSPVITGATKDNTDDPEKNSVSLTASSNPDKASLKKMVQLTAELSWAGFRAHIRVLFLGSRSEKDRILNARFSRTILATIFWCNITILPFPIAYFVRLGTNPQWAQCSGCEIEPVDAYFILFANFITCLLATLTHSAKIRRRDALRLIREWVYVWWAGAAVLILTYSLFLADPGQVYARGEFNWRTLVNFSCIFGMYIQTVHQVGVSRKIQAHLLQMSNINRAERFEDVMRDKTLANRLRAFLDSELSSEILQFLDAVDEFRANYDREGTQLRARHILDKFIQYRAPLEINIGSDMRFRLHAQLMRGNVDVKVFDEAYAEIKENLLFDGFARFLQRLGKENHMMLSQAPNRKTLIASAVVVGGGGSGSNNDSSNRGPNTGGVGSQLLNTAVLSAKVDIADADTLT